MNAVEFKSVTKYYKQKRQASLGIKDISFNIKKASIVGLIGPNGAGKSTSVKLLSGILKADSGDISVLGKNPLERRKELSREIGVMFGNRSSLWYNIAAIESVYLMKDIYSIPDEVFKERLEKYKNILNLADILDKPVRKLSLGQKIKVELLLTILHNPQLLILDEPSIGLDIIAKQNMREILFDLSKKEERTIIITSHDLTDIEKVCNHVILINKGEKILDLESTEFNKRISEYKVLYLEKFSNMDVSFFTQHIREETPQYYKFFIRTEESEELIRSLYENLGSNIQFKIEKTRLEDIVYENYS
ncbi:ATP-binding cassette domain-containing protein [Tyzzerella sp. OttesenSCG-928-J15]|nr:ATP-binding cassette domain-containing protein [Tyzzerella sp. OttesenSCG-928-J15]